MTYQGANKNRPAVVLKEAEARAAARATPRASAAPKPSQTTSKPPTIAPGAPEPMPKPAGKPQPSSPAPKRESTRPEDLPLVSVVSSQSAMDQLIEILQANVTLGEEIGWMTKTLEENKKRAQKILLEEGLEGVRHGSLYVKMGEEETKKTLDKGLIALHFCLDLDELEAHCYKESKPFRKTYIDDLSKPKGKKGQAPED